MLRHCERLVFCQLPSRMKLRSDEVIFVAPLSAVQGRSRRCSEGREATVNQIVDGLVVRKRR